MLSQLHVNGLSHSFAGGFRHGFGPCTIQRNCAVRIGDKSSINWRNSVGRKSKQRIYTSNILD